MYRLSFFPALAMGAGLVVTAPGNVLAQKIPPVRSFAPTTKQERLRSEVPASHMPPSGMCRIWIVNVPPAQQPAPTDCARAIRNRPPNGRVVFSDDEPRDDRAGGKADARPPKPKKPEPRGP